MRYFAGVAVRVAVVDMVGCQPGWVVEQVEVGHMCGVIDVKGPIWGILSSSYSVTLGNRSELWGWATLVRSANLTRVCLAL